MKRSNRANRALSLLLVLLMLLTALPMGAAAVVEQDLPQTDDERYQVPLNEQNRILSELDIPQAGETTGESVSVTRVDKPEGLELKQNAVDSEASVEDMAVEPYAADETVRMLVVMEEASLLEQGYSTEEIAANSAELTRKTAAMESAQLTVLDEISRVVSTLGLETETTTYGGEATVALRYQYSIVVNGMAIEAPYGALNEIRQLAGVRTAFVVPVYSVPEDKSDGMDTNMYATKTAVGAVQTWETLGYTGKGMRVAVVDTGLDLDHPSFAAAPELTETSLTQAELAGVLENLNAYELLDGNIAADRLYKSDKVPFGFNYIDVSLDITHDNDSQGDHGTHVAGTVAANAMDGTEVVGVAPDAQLLVMKVFGANGGAYFDDIVAALEDCFVLNVDAVNMSLGSPAGFVTDETGLEADKIFARVAESDMVAAISAGNSYSAAYGNGYGTDRNLASDPDNSVVSSPATYPGTTVVASLENESVMCNYLVAYDREIAIGDVGTYPVTALAGEHTYVMVPGYGTAEDFASVDARGKVAVVSRGELAFTDKQTNAYNAGAIACLVYDNVEADLFYMQDAGVLPNASITLESGLWLAQHADENGEGVLTIMPTDEVMITPSTIAGQLSDFSSWGVSPDLELTPDITAPGGNIYSTLDNGKYGTMSGTSMASPHIAGMSALVLQYLHEEHPELTEAQMHTVAEALIMSTAEPVADTSGVLYSPRKQGAGSANVYQAISSTAYLTVDGDTPKVSLGDDAAKRGVYTFTFEVNNLSDQAQTYAFDGSAQTEQVDLSYADYGYVFMAESGRPLSADIRITTTDPVAYHEYDADGDGDFDLYDVQYALDSVNGLNPPLDVATFDLVADGVINTADVQAMYEALGAAHGTDATVVTVPAGQSVTLSVTVTLSAADRSYLNMYFDNGMYVEGFIRAYAVGGGSDLSLPFMGFYGDWSDAPIFDTGWYYEEDAAYNRYLNVLWTDLGSSDYLLGINPYLANEAYDPAHNVLSPNGDTYMDQINEIYLGMMRNAKAIDFTWTDDATGETLYHSRADYVRKSYYMSGYGVCMPFLYNNYVAEIYDYTDAEGNYLPDGTRLTLTIEGTLDYEDDVVDETITVPIVIDTVAPTLSNVTAELAEDGTRTVSFDVSDNYDIAAVITVTEAGGPIEYIAVDDEPGETVRITIDATGYDAKFTIAVCDYGCNETYYEIELAGKHNVDFDNFYAYRRLSVVPSGNYLYVTEVLNGWYSFELPESMLMHTAMYNSGETAVAAAEYIDGYVVGIDTAGEIFAMRSGEWTRNAFGTLSIDGTVYPALDMALDVTTGTVYVLTDELEAGLGGHLVTLDVLTGAITDLGVVSGITSETAQGVTLACDNDGVLYTIDYSTGDLYTIDPATAEASFVGATGYVPQSYQSMTVDHATNELYWAAYANYTGDSEFYLVDKATGALSSVSDVEYNSELTALFKPSTLADGTYPTDAVLTGLKLSAYERYLAVGATESLLCQGIPYYAETGEISWSTSDASVVTVVDGVITAVGEGDAVVTASAMGCTAECVVHVSAISAELTFYDAYNDLTWLRLNAANPAETATVDTALTPSGAYSYFQSAAYVEGTVYAFDVNGGFYKLDAETLDGTLLGSSTVFNGTTGLMYGLAFNYADGHLYGVGASGDFFNMQYQLLRVNPANGDTQVVGTFDSNVYAPMNLAISPDGTFYFVCGIYDYDTYEFSTNLVSFRVSGDEIVGLSHTAMDCDPFYNGTSSLVYSAENEGLFWTNDMAQLWWIDPVDATVILLGDIGQTVSNYGYGNTCLYELPGSEPTPNYAEPETVAMNDSFTILVGGTAAAGVTVEPWNARADIAYSTGDFNIATVDADGILTGVSAGVTTLAAQVTTASGSETLEARVFVVEPAGTLYGHMVTNFLYGSNIWLKIPDTNPNAAEMLSAYTEAWTPYAGAYYDGTVYAYGQDAFGDYDYKCWLLKIDAMDYGNCQPVAQIQQTIRDMEFDYTTGTLYAVAESGDLVGALVQIDTTTGAVAIIGDTGIQMAAMTIDGNGTIYAIGSDGWLYEIDKTTATATAIGHTGVEEIDLYQSMHYDHNSGNTYWAQANRSYVSGLYLVDLRNGNCTNLGTVGEGAEVVALYTLPEAGSLPTIPTELDPSGVQLPSRDTVVVGQTLTLSAQVLPLSVAQVDQTLTWSTSDDSVATVSGGVVSGVSAGVAEITATTANGYSATCTVTVTAEARRFYAYDETNAQWISFDGADTSAVTVERVDAEGESPIAAAYYLDGTLYAYDQAGVYYTIDPDTFERTRVSDGVSAMTLTVTQYDWWSGEEYEYEVPVQLVDLAHDEVTGKTYGLLAGVDYGWIAVSAICEWDLTTGAMSVVFQNANVQPGNLLVIDGVAFFVDCYMNGMLTRVDLYSEDQTVVEQSLVYGYWGSALDGRSLIVDPLTGTVYVIRDNQGGRSSLWTLSIYDATVTPVGTADRIGTGLVVNGLFLR